MPPYTSPLSSPSLRTLARGSYFAPAQHLPAGPRAASPKPASTAAWPAAPRSASPIPIMPRPAPPHAHAHAHAHGPARTASPVLGAPRERDMYPRDMPRDAYAPLDFRGHAKKGALGVHAPPTTPAELGAHVYAQSTYVPPGVPAPHTSADYHAQVPHGALACPPSILQPAHAPAVDSRRRPSFRLDLPTPLAMTGMPGTAAPGYVIVRAKSRPGQGQGVGSTQPTVDLSDDVTQPRGLGYTLKMRAPTPWVRTWKDDDEWLLDSDEEGVDDAVRGMATVHLRG